MKGLGLILKWYGLTVLILACVALAYSIGKRSPYSLDLEWLTKIMTISLLGSLLSPIHSAYPLPLFMCIIGVFQKDDR
jgi:hypothetical protein